jgi:hypothetical protein
MTPESPAFLLRRVGAATDLGVPTRYEAFFGLRLQALAKAGHVCQAQAPLDRVDHIDHETRLDGQELLLTRIGAHNALPGWRRAIEVRYVVTPPDSRKGRPESVTCYLLARLSGWARSARGMRRPLERFATALGDLLACTLPAFRFAPLATRRDIADALQPVRVVDTLEVRRRRLALSWDMSTPRPLVGVPDVASVIELLLRQRAPTVFVTCVEPLGEIEAQLAFEDMLDDETEARIPSAPARGERPRPRAAHQARHDAEHDASGADEPATYAALAAAYEELTRQQWGARHLAAVRLAPYRLRIQLASAAAIGEAVVSTLAREVGGPGKLTGGLTWREPTPPLWLLASGAAPLRPRSAPERQGQQTEFTVAARNLGALEFEPWGFESPAASSTSMGSSASASRASGAAAAYLADLGEVTRCLALPSDAPWLAAHAGDGQDAGTPCARCALGSPPQ